MASYKHLAILVFFLFAVAPPGLFQSTRAQALQEFQKRAGGRCPEGAGTVTLPKSLCGQPVLFRGGVLAEGACLEAAARHLHVHARVGLAVTVCWEDRGTMAVPTANPATNGPIC